jgi:hypothetical protein
MLALSTLKRHLTVSSIRYYYTNFWKMLTESFMKILNKVGIRLSPFFTPISHLKQLLKLLSIFTLRTLHEYIDLIILKNFNSILNNRLVIFLRENKILNNEQIGFRKGSRTADHIFKLKTLICKYIQKSGKIYACFVDLKRHILIDSDPK